MWCSGTFQAFCHTASDKNRQIPWKNRWSPRVKAAAKAFFSRSTRQLLKLILDSRTLQSSPESGHRAGYDGAKRKRGSKVHIAVDTLGQLLALRGGGANEKDG